MYVRQVPPKKFYISKRRMRRVSTFPSDRNTMSKSVEFLFSFSLGITPWRTGDVDDAEDADKVDDDDDDDVDGADDRRR